MKMVNKNVNFESTEVLSTEDEKISQMLGALKRVGAPNDFDFRVKARIAAGKPVETPAFRIPAAIRYAVPLALLLAVGAYVGFNAFYSVNIADVPRVAESKPGIEKPVIAPPANDGIVVPPVNARDEQAGIKSLDVVNTLPPTGIAPKAAGRRNVRESEPGGGSYVEASNTNKPILPKGFSPDRKVPKPKDFDKNTQVPAKEILSLIGIEASYANTNWKIDFVKEHSVAQRSGLKAGDVVEAINDKAIDEKTAFGNKFSGKSLRVLRDGKRMQIELKP